MQLELTFGNDQVHLPSVRAFLNATLQELPLQSATVKKLGTFIETAVLDAILHAHPAGAQGLIKLTIQNNTACWKFGFAILASRKISS